MISKIETVNKLKLLNPRARPDDINIYADAYCDYVKATENIAKNGTVVVHPISGSPLENPYIKIRAQAAQLISKYKLKLGDLWD